MSEQPAANGITDVAMLFQLSMQSDRLRDTAKELLGTDVDDDTRTQLATRYRMLRSGLAATLDDGEAARLRRYTPRCAPRASWTPAQVFDAAGALSAFVDALLAVPAFLVNRRTQLAKVDETNGQLDKLASGNVPALEPPREASRGQYL